MARYKPRGRLAKSDLVKIVSDIFEEHLVAELENPDSKVFKRPKAIILREPRENRGFKTKRLNMGFRLNEKARTATDPEKLYVYLRNCYPTSEKDEMGPPAWIEQTLWLMAQTQSLMRLTYEALGKLKHTDEKRKVVLAEYKMHRDYYHALEKSVRATTRLGWDKGAPKMSAAMLRAEGALNSMDNTEIGGVFADIEKIGNEGVEIDE